MKKVAIGVMARAPLPGRCKTRLAASIGGERAADLCRAMLLDTLEAIEREVRADRFVVLAAPEHDGAGVLGALAPAPWEIVAQSGDGLGERLAHALTTLGADGSAVALVDADSPTAPWDAAGRTLARGPAACMGPCVDGGYWLIALRAVEPRVFADIAWSTSRVADQTRTRCEELGLALVELPVAFDVDEPDDLDRLAEELAARPSLAPRTAAIVAAAAQARARGGAAR
jgi:rSAM/selenodomain-associated transferase 1